MRNYQAEKWTKPVKMLSLYPGPFNELKIKLLKFSTSCWVRYKIMEQTSGLTCLTCPACALGHSTNQMLNHWSYLPAAMFVQNYQTAKSILFKPLHSHFFPNTLFIILWCSLWHPWNTVAFILHRTCHILYMLHLCWFRTAVLYPPRDNPYGIHGRGGGFQKFQMESME